MCRSASIEHMGQQPASTTYTGKARTKASHSGAKEWRSLGRVHIFRKRSDSLGSQDSVLCVPAVSQDT